MYVCVYVCESKRKEEKRKEEVSVSLALFLTNTSPLILGISVPKTLLSCLCLPSELAFDYVFLHILYITFSEKSQLIRNFWTF